MRFQCFKKKKKTKSIFTPIFLNSRFFNFKLYWVLSQLGLVPLGSSVWGRSALPSVPGDGRGVERGCGGWTWMVGPGEGDGLGVTLETCSVP